eukprot:6198215-Pleurochrysis_carterae.AAC.2
MAQSYSVKDHVLYICCNFGQRLTLHAEAEQRVRAAEVLLARRPLGVGHPHQQGGGDDGGPRRRPAPAAL